MIASLTLEKVPKLIFFLNYKLYDSRAPKLCFAYAYVLLLFVSDLKSTKSLVAFAGRGIDCEAVGNVSNKLLLAFEHTTESWGSAAP